MGKDLPSCRVCLRKCKKSTRLDSKFRNECPELKYMCVFNTCTRLGAVHDDELPQQLCTHCCNDLETVYNFLKLAQETDRKLRQLNNGNCQNRSNGTLGPNLDWDKANTFETEIHSTECIEHNSYDDDNVKMEFITCSRDPLEDTDEEILNSDDNLLNIKGLREIYSSDAELVNIKDSADEDDDKPLKELFTVKKFQSNNVEEDNSSVHVGYSGVNEENLNKFYEENDLCQSPKEDIPDLSISPEAQIFPQGRFKCKVCMKTYFTTAGINAHGAVHLPKAQKTKKRARAPSRKDIEPTETTDNNIIQVSDTERSHSNKGRKEKLPKPKKMFPCHVCGKHMISASKLRYHMVMHTGEKDFLCTQCPKAYSTIYALKHHMRTHTGERPYECKFCGDKFTRPTTLKSHMRRHTGERPYGCDICGKRFIQHSSMTTHMKLNHMAKTIPCPHCDKKYARQTDLTTHMLSHTGDKPFSCQLCSSRFIRQANLNKHMNQHHTDKSIASKKSLVGNGNLGFTPHSDQVAVNNMTTSNISSHTPHCALPSSDIGSNAHLMPPTSALPGIYPTSANMLPSSLIATQNNRDIIENYEPMKVLRVPPSPAPTENLQNILGNSHMMEPDRFGRAIDDINRWNWSHAS